VLCGIKDDSAFIYSNRAQLSCPENDKCAVLRERKRKKCEQTIDQVSHDSHLEIGLN
jgi:hypothetical protein